MNTFLARTVGLVVAGLLALAGCTPPDATSPSASAGASAGATPSATPTSGGATFAPFPADSVIGVALPDTTTRWTRVGAKFEAELAAAGFTPDVRYTADNVDVAQQQGQITEMIDEGARVILVAAVNGTALSAQVEAAKAAGVTVIAFDRLINDTAAVDFYVAYNMHLVGGLQATALLAGLAAHQPGETTYTIELFSGSPNDPTADWFFEGAMGVLQPKIDDGTLVVASGQTGRPQTATGNWDPANSRARMDTLLSTYYSGTAPDGVLAPNDIVAQSVIKACQAVGAPIPVLTGQDSTPEGVASIMSGAQNMTLYESLLALVDRAVVMAQDLQQGNAPQVNDSTTYDNGVKFVPSFLLVPVTVTKANAASAYQDDPDLYALTQP